MEKHGLSEEDHRFAQPGWLADLVVCGPSLLPLSDCRFFFGGSTQEEDAVRLVVRGLWWTARLA